MGWFGSIVSAVGSAFGSVVTGAVKVVRKVVEVLATKGEAFIGTVKETYAKVKPFLQKLSPYLKSAAAAVAPVFPWLSSAILAVDKTITALLALENSPVLKKLEQAIRWVIKVSKRLHEKFNAAEEVEARQHQEAFTAARAHVQTAEQKMAFDVAAMINELAIVKTGIANLLDDGNFNGFEHYLRLRATQKLLRPIDDTLATAQSADEISADDIFLVQLGATLLSDKPEMSEDETARLDSIVISRYGKKLMPFVFEEMSKMWQLALTDDQRQWKRTSAKLSEAKAKLSRLKLEALVSPLSSEEQEVLDKLTASLPEAIAANDDLLARNVEREHYISATEGFLQLLEKDEAQLRADNQEYLIDLGDEVGTMLMECAQKSVRWHELSPEQQSLIADFANIFREDSIKRSEALEVECNG
ncbi:hypothetical protein [Massilia sp. DD77]|uniref:hypothetical protein n=1 Tax=Massilia sp. DD77 TaxID=3109349 RepID=UPI002FFF360F